MTTQLPTTTELKQLFDQVNKDCAASGQNVVDYTDVEYYTCQIENLFDVDEATASEAASQLLTFTLIGL